jgi:hypothetical protein
MPDETYLSMPSTDVGAKVRKKPRFELLAVGAVIDPLARGHDPFAGGNDSGMADDRHHVTMSPRPRAQDAETILSVVIGYSLDKTCQHFPGVRLRTDHCISKLAKIRQRLPFEAGGRTFSLREQAYGHCDQATTPAKNSRKHLDFDRLRS